jgi:antitoxin YefM
VVILETMNETRSLAEAKARLSELVSRAANEHERLAVDDREALEETIAVLSDADVMRALDQAEGELARGEGEEQDSLAAAMAARRARRATE